MLNRYSERAQKAMDLAQEEAKRLGWETVDSSHLLLGLIREGNGLAAIALQNMGLDLSVVRAEVDRLIGHGSAPAPMAMSARELEFTPRAIRVLTEDSLLVSRKLGHGYVGTEHILLALLQDPEGASARALAVLGVSTDDVRALLLAAVPVGDHTANVRPNDAMVHEVLTRAAEEARGLAVRQIESEHLLLGLLRYPGGKAGSLLAGKGITAEWLRAQLRQT